MNSLKKFTELPVRDKVLFMEALALHLWTGLLLRIIPFRRIPRLFASPQSAVGSNQSAIIELIRKAVQRAGRVSPWRNKCLVSSLAGRLMLRRRHIPSRLSLGVTKEADGRVKAHAWLMTGDHEIVEKRGDFTQMYLF